MFASLMVSTLRRAFVNMLFVLPFALFINVAQAAEQGLIFQTIDRTQMQALLEKEGYAVSLDKDGDLVWKIEGFRTYMFVNQDNKAVQFHASFGDGDATLKKVNIWNKTKRYSRTYLDDEGDPHLELDLDFTGGITEARIVDFLKTCQVSFAAWLAEVVR